MIALLAEDNRNVVELVRRALMPLCETVHVATTYRDIHDIIQSNDHLTVAALDVFLPDGKTEECIEAIKYIRAKFPHCVIMVWTGYPSADEEALLKAGADGFMRKGASFNIKQLLQMLLSALDRRGLANTPAENIEFHLRVMEQVAAIKELPCPA